MSAVSEVTEMVDAANGEVETVIHETTKSEQSETDMQDETDGMQAKVREYIFYVFLDFKKT